MSEKMPGSGPYSLDVLQPPEGSSQWRWAIRKHGKMVQRSDRGYATESKARADGEEMIRRIQSQVDVW